MLISDWIYNLEAWSLAWLVDMLWKLCLNLCLLQFQKEYLKTDLHDAAMVLIGFAQNAMNMFKYSFCEKYILLKKVCKEVNSTFSLIFVICAFHYLKSTSVLMLLRLICTSLISIQLFLPENLESPWFNSKSVHLQY